MKNYKTKIQRMSCETIATVGMRVIETITQSMAEDVKNSLYATQLLEVTNRYRKAIEPNDKERNAAISDKFNIRKVLFSNSYDMAYGLTLSRDAGDKEAAIRVFSVFNMYGNKSFYGVRQSALTQRYATIIETLLQPEYSADLVRLKMTDILAELADAHTAYETLYQTKGNEQSLKAPSTEMRLEMNNALKVMVEEVEYFSKKFPTEANVTLWKNVEQRIAEVYVTAPGSTKKEDTVTTVTRSISTNEAI